MLILVKILLGLVGLGIVVFVHELGHFLAARAVGIRVEAFSFGWGRPLLAKKIGEVEYRLGAFPVGGYCKLAGDDDFEAAWKNREDQVPADTASWYGAAPWRRIIVAFAGPFFNIIFAALVFSIIWGAGFEYRTMENRIVLVHDIDAAQSMPADRGGLETGDRIIAIDGKATETYSDIQRIVAMNAEKEMRFAVIRDGRELSLTISPELDKQSGAGKIGVYAYSEPIIGNVLAGSPAEKAGLRAGDRIRAINGHEIPYTVAIYKAFKDVKEMPPELNISYERDGAVSDITIPVPAGDADMNLGIEWQMVLYHTPRYSVGGAIVKGAEAATDMLVTTVRSFRLLFRGINLTEAVSGPARITWMAGEIATEGFRESVASGLRSLGNFLALISIALGVTNLLPLPILDGGLIVLFIVEIFRRKPLHPKAVLAFQRAGMVIIGALMIFAIAGDILFFTK